VNPGNACERPSGEEYKQMENESVITLEDVDFSYNGVPVLEKVNLSIQRGDFLSMVGPNGGGKTTLLKLMTGLLKPKRGKVKLLGVAPEKSRSRIGYMPQHTVYDPHFPVSVMDVVLMGRLARRSGIYSGPDKSAAMNALEEVDMQATHKQSFATLSGGQRQRVLLARALVSRPEILLLDEPTANVDMGLENRLIDILKELNKRMTILMVTHDLGFVSCVVNHVICVNRKVKVHPTSALNGTLIQEIYGYDISMVRHDSISGCEERKDG
jgi:zinc transport system ATP-binding protein